MYGQFNSRRQFLDRLEHRPAEFVQSCPVQSSLEGFAYIAAGHPELDITLFVDYGVLDKRESEARAGGKKESLP